MVTSTSIKKPSGFRTYSRIQRYNRCIEDNKWKSKLIWKIRRKIQRKVLCGDGAKSKRLIGRGKILRWIIILIIARNHRWFRRTHRKRLIEAFYLQEMSLTRSLVIFIVWWLNISKEALGCTMALLSTNLESAFIFYPFLKLLRSWLLKYFSWELLGTLLVLLK